MNENQYEINMNLNQNQNPERETYLNRSGNKNRNNSQERKYYDSYKISQSSQIIVKLEKELKDSVVFISKSKTKS